MNPTGFLGLYLIFAAEYVTIVHSMLSLGRSSVLFGTRAVIRGSIRPSSLRNYSTVDSIADYQSLAKLVNYNTIGSENGTTGDGGSGNEDLGNPGLGMVKHLMSTYKDREIAPREFVVEVLKRSIKQHRALPNVAVVSRSHKEVIAEDGTASSVLGCINVVGDTHGQYTDFCSIFDDAVAGFPSDDNRFVINGDMVDRGPMSVEIVMVALLTKLLSPNVITILRGNHETTIMNRSYGFEREVLRKYDGKVLQLFRDLFDSLQVAAVVENVIFVTHGGLGPLTMEMTIDDINRLDRMHEPSDEGAICELLWSDPKDNVKGYVRNRGRSIAYYFGKEVTAEFLKRNNLQLLIRSHEVFNEGFKLFHDNLCLSVFSAPNYCGQVGNAAAIVRFEDPHDMSPSIVMFNSVSSSNNASFLGI